MLSLELKFAPTGEVVGYASLFGGPPDAVNDLVAPGAFKSSLATEMPEMLREHRGPPIGEWHDAVEDELGLRVQGIVTDPATLAELRAGRLDGLSIGYVTRKSRNDASGRRVLEDVDLREVSIVKRPASSRARVLSVKSAPPAHSKRGLKMADPMPADQVDNEPDADDAEIGDRVDALEKSVASIDKRLAAVEGAIKDTGKSVKSIETLLRRPGVRVPNDNAPDVETKAFARFLRYGIERIEPVEAKSLRIADDTGAGFLAPPEFVKEIVKNIVLISPVRQVARVMQTTAQQVVLPRRTATLTASWVGETQTRSSTQATYGAIEFPVREMGAYVDVSNAMLEDSAFDIASELASDFAEQFGKTEGAAFVNGDGVNKPFGIMQSADIPYTPSTNASAITADSIIALFHALPTFYAANAVWAMNRTTLGVVRQLKDSQNRYLVNIEGMAGQPSPLLLGRPVVELPDMPDVAANAFPIVIGDFKQGYRIFDRLSVAILRDPYSQQASGLVRFHARRRVAGSVAKAEAFRKLKISVS